MSEEPPLAKVVRSCDDRAMTIYDGTGGISGGVRFGVLVLPNEPWPELRARWRRLDQSGVDSVWSCDHFTNGYRPDSPWFQGWTGLAALATETEHVTVGLLVGAIVSRPPTMLVKQAVRARRWIVQSFGVMLASV